MLLHEGLRPFECEGCGKKFARLDALTRHRKRLPPPPLDFPRPRARIRSVYCADFRPDKSEQGQECAITHPLPTNPDGSAMSESQYKAFKGIQDDVQPGNSGTGRKKASAAGAGAGAGGGSDMRVKREEDDHSGLSDFDGGGMSEYDVAA